MDLQNETKQKLYPDEKIKNYPLYFYRIFAKLLSLFIFGVGTVLLSIICLPVGMLIFRSKQKLRYHMRHLIYVLFNFFIKFMWLIGVIKVKVDKKDFLKKHGPAIIVANHPAYLDSPIMISLLPHTSIIAKAALSKNIMTVVIHMLYMPNSLPFEEILSRVKEDFKNGNTLVMFPEGTRSTPYGQNHFKKGAARISLATGAPIIPVYIGGTSKAGLGKGDKILQYNPSKRYIYDIKVKEPVYPEEFKDLPPAIAAKRFTHKIRDILSDEANAQYRY